MTDASYQDSTVYIPCMADHAFALAALIPMLRMIAARSP